MTEISQDLPMARFQDSRPDGIVEREVDAFSGLLPGPGTVATVKELFIEGTEPTRRDDLHVAVQIDAATGLLWQEGCTGPMETRMFLDFSGVEPRFPEWQRFTQGWAERAARGPGVRGGPKRTRTMYFYNLSYHPYGATWGGRFKPTEVCQSLQPCPPEPLPTTAEGLPIPCFTPEPEPTKSDPGNGPPTKEPGPTPTKPPNGKPTPTPTPLLGTILPSRSSHTPAPSEAGIPIVAIAPLLVPLLALLAGRLVRPARPPSRHHRPRPAPPPGSS
jgi:hypothetical protein